MPSDAVLTEFKRLFSVARKEHSKAGSNATPDSPAHQAAVAYALAHKIPGAELLLECLVAARHETQREAALEKITTAQAQLPANLQGHAISVQGLLFAFLKRFDDAINCFKQAIDSPGYDTPGGPCHNIGLIYHAKGQDDLAISYFQQAIDTAYYDTPNKTRNFLALSLRKQGKYQEALAQVEKVLKQPDVEGEHERARILKELIEESLAGVKPTLGEEALVNAESDKGGDTFEQLILQKLGRQEQGRKDKYDEYLEQPISSRDNVFSCLRGWSSAVTLLEGSADSHWVGGGYFLKWRGKGIVIDPGFDFIDNFHDAHYHMREVDAVLVSHNHTDHNYDLGSVDDLRYQLHTRWKTLPPKKKRKLDVSQCLFVMDEDTAKVFSQNRAEHRGSPIHFSAASHERQWWIKKANGLPVTVEHFPVWHGHEVLGAVGMRLRLHGTKGQPDFIIGYTGDTEYFEKLPEELKDCDVLLAHISQPEEEELLDPAEYEKKKKAGEIKHLTTEGFKKKHLGYNGLIRLVKETQPKLVLVGEFWAGLEDIRIDLIKGLSKRTGNKTPILPTGLGFHLKLPSLEVECTSCHKPVPHHQIKIAPATSPFGPLGYLCPHCLG